MILTTHMLILMAAACAKPAACQIKEWTRKKSKS